MLLCCIVFACDFYSVDYDWFQLLFCAINSSACFYFAWQQKSFSQVFFKGCAFFFFFTFFLAKNMIFFSFELQSQLYCFSIFSNDRKKQIAYLFWVLVLVVLATTACTEVWPSSLVRIIWLGFASHIFVVKVCIHFFSNRQPFSLPVYILYHWTY